MSKGENTDGAARKRGPSLVGVGSRPMVDDPRALLRKNIRHIYRSSHTGQQLWRRLNAVQARSRSRIYCLDCAAEFEGNLAAVEHCARHKHVVVDIYAYEIVPVDVDEDWQYWADGAGVSWADRHPEADW